jgi:hypothetical protein
MAAMRTATGRRLCHGLGTPTIWRLPLAAWAAVPGRLKLAHRNANLSPPSPGPGPPACAWRIQAAGLSPGPLPATPGGPGRSQAHCQQSHGNAGGEAAPLPGPQLCPGGPAAVSASGAVSERALALAAASPAGPESP